MRTLQWSWKHRRYIRRRGPLPLDGLARLYLGLPTKRYSHFPETTPGRFRRQARRHRLQSKQAFLNGDFEP